MEIDEYLAALTAEGELLAAAASRVEHSADVPGAPAWQVQDVIRHLGQVHRWAEAIVRLGARDEDHYTDDDGADQSGAALVEWFRSGHEALVETLAAADPDVAVFTFLPAPSPLAFWAWRQLHETGIHRADVESGGGPITPFDRNVALDGIDELVGGFAARPSKGEPAGPVRTLGVVPNDSDRGWLVRPGSRPVQSADAAAGADCVLRATASDLHLLLWNRPTGEVDVAGDPAVLDDWRRRIRIRWGRPDPRRPDPRRPDPRRPS